MTDTEFKNTTKVKLRERLEQTTLELRSLFKETQSAQTALRTADAQIERLRQDQERLKIARELIQAYLNAAYPLEPTERTDQFGNVIYSQAGDITSRFLGEVLRVLDQ